MKDMDIIPVDKFRDEFERTFERAANGERLLIGRPGEVYELVRIGKEDTDLSPELQKRIDKAVADYKEGRVVKCRTNTELQTLLAAL